MKAEPAQSIFAAQALMPGGWANGVRLSISAGAIAEVQTAATPAPQDHRADVLIPGLSNMHSHAFQRGMAGLAETRGSQEDSFWTWRDMMYRFALALSPEEMQAVAEMAYVEMLEAGFTRVGEFHYLHHAPDGSRYANPAEMSLRIFAAAASTGIALTHLPVFYAHSDFGGKPPHEGQRRFINGLDPFLKLQQYCKAALTRQQDRLGFAPHSLRAATPEEISALVSAIPDVPIHIHVSEQLREVADGLGHFGKRPVQWLLDNQDINARWCLIHATHLTGQERQALAGSPAVVGLCPVTEANLGDGIFPAGEFLAEGGSIGVGTDSNVHITAAGELNLLEYGQRLSKRARNVLAESLGSTGSSLYRHVLKGSAQALGAPEARLAAGAPADLVALNDPLGLLDDDRTLDRWIFGNGLEIADVWAGGEHCVRAGAHIKRASVATRFAKTMRALLSAFRMFTHPRRQCV